MHIYRYSVIFYFEKKGLTPINEGYELNDLRYKYININIYILSLSVEHVIWMHIGTYNCHILSSPFVLPLDGSCTINIFLLLFYWLPKYLNMWYWYDKMWFYIILSIKIWHTDGEMIEAWVYTRNPGAYIVIK